MSGTRQLAQAERTSRESYLHVYFFFFPLPPAPPFAGVPPPDDAVPPLSNPSALPCVAPPPPPAFLLLPCPNVDRSLFFSHRSGSGGGVTPGTTPAGTREARTFLGTGWVGSAADTAAFVAEDNVEGPAWG